MMEHQRHLDIFDPRGRKDTISIVGMGGIGSFTAVALCKLGVNTIHLYDKDVVEEHNVPVQMMPIKSVGHNKVDAIALLVHIFSGMEIIKEDDWDPDKKYNIPIVVPHNQWVDDDTELYGIVVSAVDSIKARRSIFEAFQNSPSATHIVDPRLGGEAYQVITISKGMDEMDWYEDSQLPEDDSVPDLPCTAAAVIDVGFSVAGSVVNTIRKVLVGRPYHVNFTWDAYNSRYTVNEGP